MTLAPIVLFVYNRPWHTRQTLEALSKNVLADQSQLFVYADGPRVKAKSEEIRQGSPLPIGNGEGPSPVRAGGHFQLSWPLFCCSFSI